MAGITRKDLVLRELKRDICENGLNYCITPNGVTTAPNLRAWLKNADSLEGILIESDKKDSALLKSQGFVYKLFKVKSEDKSSYWDIVFVRNESSGLTALNDNLSESLNEVDRGVGLEPITDLKDWVDENKDALVEVDDLTYVGNDSATFTSEGKEYRIIKEQGADGSRWAVIDSVGKLAQKKGESDIDYLKRYVGRQLNYRYVDDSFLLVIDLRKGLYKAELEANNINLVSLTEDTATIEYKGNKYNIVNIGADGSYSWGVQAI